MEIDKKTIYRLVESAAREYGNIPALETKEGITTYHVLYEEVYRIATGLQRDGYQGKYVEIEPKLSEDFIKAYLALTISGAIVVLHEPGLMMEQYDVSIFKSVSAREILETVPGEKENYKQVSGEDECTLIFTSGTSGKQKGVLLTHKNLISDVELAYFSLGGEKALKSGDRTIPVLPVFHMFGITASILASIYIGMTMCMIDDIRYLGKEIGKIKPKIVYLVPMVLKTLLKKANQAVLTGKIPQNMVKPMIFGGTEILISGGAPLTNDIIEGFKKYDIEVLNGYGITECSPVVTVSTHQDYKIGSVGKVNQFPGVEVVIHNGCICIGGDIVMKGYYSKDENEFIKIDGKKFFNTKDNGIIDEDDNLFITGRITNLIILEDGNNVSPEEIEQMIEVYEDVEGVIVYPHVTNTGEVLGVTIKLKDEFTQRLSEGEKKTRAEQIVAEVNDKLPSFKKLRNVRMKNGDFVRTSLNKIKRIEENWNE